MRTGLLGAWGRWPVAVALLAASAAGCGGGSGGDPASKTGSAQAIPAGNYLPLTVGTVWTYNITALSGATGQGTETVEASENAPQTSQPSMRVHEVLLDGGTRSWEQLTGATIVRYEEDQLDQTGAVVTAKQYTPAIVVLDESAAHLTAGDNWIEQYLETNTPTTKSKNSKELAQWTLEAVGESVTVPAGTYSCIRVRRNHTTSKTPSDVTTWYAQGVGKVKEVGAGQYNDQTLELASVSTH